MPGRLCAGVSLSVFSSCLSPGRGAGWRGVDALLDLEEGVLLVGGGHHLVAISAALSYRALVIRRKRSLSRRQWEKRRKCADSEFIRHLNLEGGFGDDEDLELPAPCHMSDPLG